MAKELQTIELSSKDIIIPQRGTVSLQTARASISLFVEKGDTRYMAILISRLNDASKERVMKMALVSLIDEVGSERVTPTKFNRTVLVLMRMDSSGIDQGEKDYDLVVTALCDLKPKQLKLACRALSIETMMKLGMLDLSFCTKERAASYIRRITEKMRQQMRAILNAKNTYENKIKRRIIKEMLLDKFELCKTGLLQVLGIISERRGDAFEIMEVLNKAEYRSDGFDGFSVSLIRFLADVEYEEAEAVMGGRACVSGLRLDPLVVEFVRIFGEQGIDEDGPGDL